MIRWEYNTIIDRVESMAESVVALDDAGRDGWEVIAVTVSSFGHTYLMKRPLPNQGAAKSVDENIKHSHSMRFICTSSCPYSGTVHEITS